MFNRFKNQEKAEEQKKKRLHTYSEVKRKKSLLNSKYKNAVDASKRVSRLNFLKIFKNFFRFALIVVLFNTTHQFWFVRRGGVVALMKDAENNVVPIGFVIERESTMIGFYIVN
jgi:hypothetical protein